MKQNMGTTDRIIRSIIAVIFFVLYYNDIIPGTLGIVLVVISVVFLLTSFISFCPLYSILGITTLRKKKGNA